MRTLKYLLTLVLLLPLQADSLRSGKPLPALSLPPIEGGAPVATHSFLGEKLMLHLFASW